MFENTIYSQVIIIDPDMVISPSTASAMYCIVQVQNWDTKKGSPLIYVYLNTLYIHYITFTLYFWVHYYIPITYSIHHWRENCEE